MILVILSQFLSTPTFPYPPSIMFSSSLPLSPHLWMLSSLPPKNTPNQNTYIQEPEGEGFGKSILFRVEYFKVSHSLYIIQCGPVLITIYFTNKLLWREFKNSQFES